MTKKNMILIATPIVLIGAYIIYRERKPSLEVNPSVDWDSKVPTVKFGFNKEALNNGNGTIDAGITFSKRYSLHYITQGNLMVLEVKNRRGEVVERKTVDFKGKLVY